MTLHRLAEIFARGVSFTRSYTHPCVPTRVGPLWVLRDAPRTRGDRRNEEWLAHGLPPARLIAAMKRAGRPPYSACYLQPVRAPAEPVIAAFKRAGWRYIVAEPMMIHHLGRIAADGPRPAARVVRVTTPELADRLQKAARTRQILPEHLTADPPPVRQCAALRGTTIVGWVRSIVVGPHAWLSNMYVERRWRRRGIGRQLLRQALRDDRAAGARASVLTASHTGAKLYEAVGYRQLATLFLFTPPRR